MENWKTAYLGIGANLGNAAQQLKIAAMQLYSHPAIRLRQCSPIYQTKAVTDEVQPDYLNAVLEIETTLNVHALLNVCQNLEKKAGRIRTRTHAPRELDIDILLFDRQIVDDQSLTVPHPRMSERAFVLIPLNDIAPDLFHPVVKQTVRKMLESVSKQDVLTCYDATFWEQNQGVAYDGK